LDAEANDYVAAKFAYYPPTRKGYVGLAPMAKREKIDRLWKMKSFGLS